MGKPIVIGQTLTGIDGRIDSVDPAFCAMLNLIEGDLIGRDIIDITHIEDRGDTQIDMRRLRDEGRDFVIRKRYIRSDGSTIWAQANASIVTTARGDKMIAGRITPILPDPILESRRARHGTIFDALDRQGSLSSWPAPTAMRSWQRASLGWPGMNRGEGLRAYLGGVIDPDQMPPRPPLPRGRPQSR